ncbi:MAG: hypothetical protein IKR46_00210, partial [Clostridia bacterium]|nr:hypothetical protein [Clostridia bacterium]
MNITKAKEEKAVFIPYLSLFARVVFTAVLFFARVAGVCPFGLAYAAAVAEENMLAALLGLAAGVLWSAENAVKYILAAAVYGVMIYIRKFEEKGVKAVAIGTAIIFSSLVTAITFGLTPSKFLIMLPEAFAVGGLYCLFSNIKKGGTVSFAAELLLAGAVFCAIYGMRIPYLDVNIAVFAAMLAAMSISYSSGVPIAVLSGAVLGFMTFLNTPSAIEMSGLFALSALFGALLSKMGKTGVSMGFLSGATICVLLIGRLGVLSMADIFAAPIIFLIIPQKWAVKMGSHINNNLADEKGKEEVENRIKTVAKAVEDLGSGVRLLTKKEAAAGGYSEVFDRVCEGCKKQETC